jgi:hypothetical protein
MVTTAHEEGGRFVDTACEAHLMIDEVSIEYEAIKAKCTVLGATDPSQVGRSVSEFFKYSGKAAAMALNLAEACGLITREDRRRAQEQGAGVSFDETMLKGKQFCARITMERVQRRNPVTGAYEPDPDKPNPFARIGFNSFSVWDKKAEAIPKDPQFLPLVPKPAAIANAAFALPPAAPPAAPPAQQQTPLSGPATPAMSMNW